MLSNPFCFVLQVLAVLQEIRLSQRGCLPGIKQAELLRRYGPEPSPLADYGISSIKSPHTARWPLRPSSVTSHHVSILEATKGREPVSHPSGPGSSTTGGMLSNPFCFVLQVLAVLQEIRLSQRGCLPGIKQAELLRRYGPEPSPLADYGISSIKSPHTARWPLRPSSVTSHHVSILEATKGREPASHPSGPGSSTTGGMLSNPFCFVLQVLAVLQEIRLSQRGCLPGIKQAELLRRYGPEPSPLADYGISSIKSPHTARWPLRPSS
ncbi:hypothetical protein MRX96_052183, partial [Rhipicephalus microplus]